MKKIITLAVCITVFLSVLGTFSFAAPKKDALTRFYDSIDDLVTETANADGSVTYVMAPLYSKAAAKAAQFPVSQTHVGYKTNQIHTPLNTNNKYLYSLLDKEDKLIYLAIDGAVRNLETSVQYTGPKEKYRLYFLYMADNPDVFYLGNSITINNHGDTFGITFAYYYSKEEYCGYGHGELTPELRQKILDKKEQFETALECIVSSIPADATELEKEALVYAKLSKSANYNLGASFGGVGDDNWSAYGVIYNGYGVCESFSEAFQTVCYAVGISCTPIVGTAGGGHKWNAVYIEGDWYQCDLTFDNPIGSAPDDVLFYYFNRTDEQMSETHNWEDYEYELPECTATKCGTDSFQEYYEFGDDSVLHVFESGCDEVCSSCSYSRSTWGKHSYESSISRECTVCGYIRKGGWTYEENDWYYYKNGERVINAFASDSVGLAYLGFYGNMLRDTRFYHGEDQYYADKNGYIAKNRWVLDGSCWFYAEADGTLFENGWLSYGGKWYCFDKYGTMLENDWAKDSAGWCYLGTGGAMVNNGWILWNMDWYYISDGHMVENKWMLDSKDWCYLGSGGAMVKNSWVKDSIGWCYVGSDGYLLRNRWQKDSQGWCYLGADGYITTGSWVKYNGQWYYCNEGGYMVTGTHKIDGKWYTFSQNGNLI